MRPRLFCNPERQLRVTSLLNVVLAAALMVASAPAAIAGNAPPWMHSLVNAPLPDHTERTEAVLLYSETNVTVISTDKIRTQVREAYKILRPEGRNRGTVWVFLNSRKKVKNLHGWCIPAAGADYEVKDKDSTEVSPR